MGDKRENLYPTPETIAKLCLNKYEELPKTGKPTAAQWTVISGIVLYNAILKHSQVVALGLGTKCIGKSKMCRNGLIINDSHAEILARRGFMRYLYQQVKEARLNKPENVSTSIVVWNMKTRTYEIKTEYSFHFYSSQAPCGDACIVDETRIAISEVTPAKRSKLVPQLDEDAVGRPLLTSKEVVYTGGKLLKKDHSANEDQMAQTVGALRIKPGKGDRTLSMSCSDKLSKWYFLGVQGALIYNLFEKPIYFATMNFNHEENLDVQTLERAIFKRWNRSGLNFEYNAFRPFDTQMRICDKSVSFNFSQRESCSQPCPNGLVWCDVSNDLKSCEVIVNGKRQGCTKKKLATIEAAVKISKYKLFQDFIDVVTRHEDLLDKYNITDRSNLATLKYCDAKNLAKSYQKAWTILKSDIFGLWTQKPLELLQFSLNSVKNESRENL